MKYAITIIIIVVFCAACQQIFGGGCTESMSYYPPHSKKAIRLAMNENTRVLSRWLRSNNKILQAYAVSSYHYMYKEGYKIDTDILARINKVKQDTTQINTCSGCLFWKRSMRDALDNYKFE